MSLISDTDYLIHSIRLSYLRDVEDAVEAGVACEGVIVGVRGRGVRVGRGGRRGGRVRWMGMRIRCRKSEILAAVNQLPSASKAKMEKADFKKRTCTVGLYGPWAGGHSVFGPKAPQASTSNSTKTS
ncbi:hypothetical protein NMY22_g14601 [Coprinellus aureogranulatus]|nr:hypothetical protein NMY22_g14601 [Coprinellus aureogranulatus]